ncbi:MAG TPA: hypothetical protein PKM25_09620 [Candidatus Ozemobacteraceae bacterium]|nr:hypothetical protein [Candidatus Ozemobacteraceae bacterium]
MVEIYKILMDQAVAQFVTLAIFGLITCGWVYRLWSNAQLAHVKLTPSENIQLCVFGAGALIIGIILFGYIAFPSNADSLMEALNMKHLLQFATHYVQRGLLWVVRLMM